MEYWIWLSRIQGLGPIKTKQLLEIYKTPEKIWKATKQELMDIDRIGKKIARRNYKPRIQKKSNSDIKNIWKEIV